VSLSLLDIENIEEEVMSEYGHEHPLLKFSFAPEAPEAAHASEAALRGQRALVFKRLQSADEEQAIQVFRLLSEGFSVEESFERAEVPFVSRRNPFAGSYSDLLDARENPERKSSKVQSVLIPKDSYTLSEARKWIKGHKFVDKGVDETDRYYRFRQFAPTKHYAYRTIAFGQSGIKAVLRVSKKPR
jgi:hypothetical protein